jgi:hypothetical protein
VSERRVGLFSERFLRKRIAGAAGNLLAGGVAASRLPQTAGRRPGGKATRSGKKARV